MPRAFHETASASIEPILRASRTGRGLVPDDAGIERTSAEPRIAEYLPGLWPDRHSRPVKVATGVSSSATGSYHSLYVRRDHTLWAMGWSPLGRLGHGGGLVQWEPKQVRFGTPAILSQSIPFALRLGQSAVLSVKAVGSGTLTYQWRKNGKAISGATSSSWLLHGATAADGAVYDVVVSNSLGSKACTAVNLSIVDAAPVIAGSLTVNVPRLSDEFEYYITANNDAMTFAAEGLPPGLVLDPGTGRITGKIESPVGVVTVAVTATNANGSTTATLTINVTPQAVPVITSATTLLARQGQSSNYTISASNSPTRFSAANLPAGLTVDPVTGVVTGKVLAAPGDYVATISASNLSGTASSELKLIVLPVWAGVAAGGSHSLFVDTDGALWSMGDNSYGQLGRDFRIPQSSPQKVADNVVAVDASDNTSAFLKSDGTLWVAGYVASWDAVRIGDRPMQMASRVRDIGLGFSHLLFVDWDGTLWAHGSNSAGQLGDGTTTDRPRAVAVASGVASATAGRNFSLFVKRDGSLWGMGWNQDGQLGDGTTTDRLSPIRISTGVRSASAGSLHTLFVKTDGSLWAMGHNSLGRLGDGTNITRLSPMQVRLGVVGAWGNQGSLFLTEDGELWGMGQIDAALRWVPERIATSIAGAACGANHMLLIDSAGRLLSAGSNAQGQLGESSMTVSHYAKIADDVLNVAGASDHTMFVKQNGTLWGMGEPYAGQRGAYELSFDVKAVESVSGVKEVAVGRGYTLFLRTDGTLWGMGDNAYGQIGGGETMISTPLQIAAGVDSVTSASNATLFVTTTGAMWGMGYNLYGQLGDGSHAHRHSPVKILEGVRSAVVGSTHSLMLKTDDSLWGAGV